jgi:hypothetical protein
MLRVPVGQAIGAAFFLVTSFLAAQKEVTRLQTKNKDKKDLIIQIHATSKLHKTHI